MLNITTQSKINSIKLKAKDINKSKHKLLKKQMITFNVLINREHNNKSFKTISQTVDSL